MAQPKTTRKTTARRSPVSRAKPATNGPLTSYNPGTGQVLAEIEATLPEEVANIVEHARKVAPEWAAIGPKGRAHILKEVRVRIYEMADEIVDVVSSENGKPRAEVWAHEIVPTLLTLAYLERATPKALAPEKIGRALGLVAGGASHIEWRPFGVVGAIGPWNYPFFNTFLSFTSALFAGNTVVIKPSEVTPQTGELIRKALDPLPAGVATVIQGGGAVGAALVDAPCDKISFIGSPPTGRKICEAASKHLTPVVMELGGMDAAVVLEDANIDTATSGVLWGAFMNTGQTCCAVERTYVSEKIADEFNEQFLAKLAKLRQSADGELGAITFDRQFDIVSRHVTDAIKKGATVLAGGPDAGRHNEAGTRWYAPTVLTDVSDDMDVIKEESFGPVVSIVRFQDDDEAITRANGQGTNLTASVWSGSRSRAERVAKKLKAGTVTINSHGDALAMPWAPWGGVGESGFGRLNGELGLREFSVPVHVTRNLVPKLKKLWWYPYDQATEDTLRGVAAVLGAPGIGNKAKAIGGMLGNIKKAVKAKL